MKFLTGINQKWVLAIFIIIAIAIRLFFYFGHIFSDDAYYSKLSISLINGEHWNSQNVYPAFLLRVLFVYLNAICMNIFGANETSTIILPFIVSILNIVLIYKFACLFFDDTKTALIAASLIIFFPVEVVFATISFADSTAMFLINTGLYFLYKSYKQNTLRLSFIAGIFFCLSMLVKEYYPFVLTGLLLIFAYNFIVNKIIIKQIVVVCLFTILFFISEAIIYKLVSNDFLYRFNLTNLNYAYSFYDFFPFSAFKLTHSNNFAINIAAQILLNIKHIFFRRFYLFLPLIALCISIFSFKKKNFSIVNVWFFIISVLLISLTTSLGEYKPMNLSRSWYVFPLILPAVLIVSSFLSNQRNKTIVLLFVLYLTSSLFMINEYRIFFDYSNKKLFKDYLLEIHDKTIFTDHFTKYSLELLQSSNKNTYSFTNKDINDLAIKKNDLLIINLKHIDELKLQGFKFPANIFALDADFKRIKSFNDFKVYQKQN